MNLMMLKGNIKPTYPDCEGKHPLKLHLSSKLKTKNKTKSDSLYMWGSSSRDFKSE